MKVRVKSRSGHGYIRCERQWPGDRWARVDLDDASVARLRADPHLDVVDLAESDTVDAPERTPLEAAEAELVTLRAENARLCAEIDARPRGRAK